MLRTNLRSSIWEAELSSYITIFLSCLKEKSDCLDWVYLPLGQMKEKQLTNYLNFNVTWWSIYTQFTSMQSKNLHVAPAGGDLRHQLVRGFSAF